MARKSSGSSGGGASKPHYGHVRHVKPEAGKMKVKAAPEKMKGDAFKSTAVKPGKMPTRKK